MSAPAHTTGDRADRVVVGQWVHLSPLVLGDVVPTDGWLSVVGVSLGAEHVVLTLADETTVSLAANRLVRIGWS